MERRLATWCAAAMVCAGVAATWAGPLDPPPGPVSDTSLPGPVYPAMKTLGQIEPRTAVQSLPSAGTAQHVISAPGSYYLTGNITGTAGKHGISITAEHVTLDLNGFALIGASGAGDGITTAAFLKNVAVVNGSVKGWPGSGVNVQTDNGRLEGLRVSNCTLAGISTGTSLGTMIIHCTLQDNAGGNLFTGAGCTVEGCNIINTSLLGTAIGINTADGTIVRDCNLQGLRGVGIQAGGSCTILNNTIVNGRADAVNVGQRSMVKGNNISGHVGSGIVLSGQACMVVDNMLVSNAPGSTIAGGIITSQNNHHITGNTMMSNGLGLKCTGLGSFIARNTGRANATSFTISGSNSVGPLVNISLQGDIADIPAANHPWANFTY
ncbi:MAG: right-handed parallel beta-helix repeat-containing protein [Phycisphaerales bacterium]